MRNPELAPCWLCDFWKGQTFVLSSTNRLRLIIISAHVGAGNLCVPNRPLPVAHPRLVTERRLPPTWGPPNVSPRDDGNDWNTSLMKGTHRKHVTILSFSPTELWPGSTPEEGLWLHPPLCQLLFLESYTEAWEISSAFIPQEFSSHFLQK